MEKIETYLQALQLGEHNKEVILGTINRLKSCGLQELSTQRLLVAAVYCQLLQYCQVLYDGKVPEEIVIKLLSVFENIEQIGEEATDEEKEDSSLITVWFLHELKIRRELGDVWRMDDNMLFQSVDILLKELDNIYFIFEIKENGHVVFPINAMIAKVVEKQEFISPDTPLSSYHIHILQLAVKLFKNNEDEKKILQELLDKCNLKFINYLHLSGCIIDTPDLLNHQKNGVMIFYNRDTSKVLIRHENEEYFMSEPAWRPKNLEFNLEYDYHRNKIGAFVEYTLDKSDCLIDYSDALETEEGREEFLKLVFERGVYNTLISDSLIQKADKSCLPVNPYCCNDEVIVKGRQKGSDGKCYDKQHFLDALTRYRSSALRISSTYVMNRVSFGLVILLLQKENVGINCLGLHAFSEDDWYQSQMIKKWVENCKDQMEALKFIVEQWYRENQYCGHRNSSKKSLKEKNIQDHQIEALDFYPVKSDLSWIYQMMGCGTPEDWYVLCGKIIEDCNGNNTLNVDLYADVCGKRFCRNTGKTALLVNKESLEDEDELINDEWGDRQEYYFLYDSKYQIGKVYDQLLLKMLSGIERLQENNHFTLQVASKITKMHYREISSLMQLHELAFHETGKRIFCNFDSQVYYRFIHNMIWNNIDESTVDSYLRIFLHHQKLTFDQIDTDEQFRRRDINTLYVPKDSRQSDSVLSSIYDNYLKAKGCREMKDLYDPWLELREDGYYHNNNRIKNIVFLCDNFEYGTATKRMLRAYLDIEIDDIADAEEKEKEKKVIEEVKAREHRYYLKESTMSDMLEKSIGISGTLSPVLLKDVVDRNDCTVEVHSYYGTNDGKNAIDSFLQDQGLAFIPSSYEREILKKASQIAKDVQRVWPQIKCGEFYTVVREFNMTKANVFPKEMLCDPKKAICMFVKKKEIPMIS